MFNSSKKYVNQPFGILPIKSFSDNYIWALVYKSTAIIVDPGESEPVLRFLASHQLQLSAILLTHNHYDHTAGVQELASIYKNVLVYGPKKDQRLSQCNVLLEEGDVINFPELDVQMSVYETPGHTVDHIVYHGRAVGFSSVLFSGDTLFSGGCGRVLSGTYLELFNSLKRLSQLPLYTRIYCGHEYTYNNLQWAISVDPRNSALKEYYKSVCSLNRDKYTTLPSFIGKELKINPFLRIEDPDILRSVSKRIGYPVYDSLEVFSELRKWKNIS